MHLVLELRRVFLDFRRFCAVSLCRKEKQSSLNIRRNVLRLFRRNFGADFPEQTVRKSLSVAGKNRRALCARRYDWAAGTCCKIRSEAADFYFVSTLNQEDGWVKKDALIPLN